MTELLFIDDEEGVRRSVKRALENERYVIHVAGSGQDGLRLICEADTQVEVVVSDYKMPGMNGIETLSKIAAIIPGVTRILLTGYATLQSAIEATNEGLDGFLTKPFDNVELRNRIREILVRKRLGQFICPSIYEKIKADPSAIAPRKHLATILFTDIRDFSRMARQIAPEQIAELLNVHYFSPLGEIAHQYKGTVDKHIGDSIMVTYGCLSSQEDDVHRAVACALEMQRCCNDIDKWLSTKLGLSLKVGIGVATGEVVSGVFGSLRKREFTAFGLPVIVAARLEKIAKDGEVLISETTYQKVGHCFTCEKIAKEVEVRGVSERPVAVYRVLGQIA